MSQDCGVYPERMGFCPQKTVKMLIWTSSLLISLIKDPQAASTRDSKAPSLEIFMCSTICGDRRVTQATDSLGAQEQGGPAERGMETYHSSAWRVWSP